MGSIGDFFGDVIDTGGDILGGVGAAAQASGNINQADILGGMWSGSTNSVTTSGRVSLQGSSGTTALGQFFRIDATVSYVTAGWKSNALSSVTAIRLYVAGGSFTTGTVSLYSIKD